MASQRPPSGMGRPMSRSGSVVPGAGRPPTAVRPPPTAIRVATGMVPGTSGHPGMRGGIPVPTPGVLSAQIKVTDRPVTQQGLSGMKTGMKGPQRQILDKSYYLGLLRSKINELTTETMVFFYNCPQSVKNPQMTNPLREEAIRAIEEEIRRERRVADEVVQSMPAAKQEKYFTMATANEDLLQVKEDNQEIASMERQLTEIRERTGQITEEIRQLEQDSEEAQGNKLHDWFLESFEESRAQEQEKMTQSQENIISLLEHCSRNMLRLRQVDTVTANELRNMQEVLVSKETEVVQSESTAKGLTTESRRLQQDLEKVQQLEGKITGELSTLKERVSTMESELHTYRDLDTLRRTAEEKKKRLQEDRVSLTQRRDSFKQLLEEMNQKYEASKTKLQENETHAQLANLERKWQHLEQNNFVMKEFIASKSQESDYASVAKNVFQQVAEYNKCLIDSLQNNRS
uniref:Intraflagellar transport 74 n=1 Tax=Lates calcarifer TaxID=8187 RepID=A0A4W6BVS9_LATCA